MLVLVTGLPLFSKRLVEDLNSMDPTNKYLFLDTYNSKWAQLLFLFTLPFSGLVISMNGVTDKSGSLNWVVRFRKKLILQWMGTDVLIATERFKDETINRKYINYGENFVDSSWLKDELNEIEVKSKIVRFKYSDDKNDPVEKYDRMSVVSYIGAENQKFYGLYIIIELAKLYPDISFHLYGLSQTEVPVPENIICHGWQPVEVFQKALRENPICLRLIEHDGFSVTALEAITYGAEVIWSLPYEYSHLAKTVEDASVLIKDLTFTIEQRGMTPNNKNIKELKDYFNREKVLNNYILVLNELMK